MIRPLLFASMALACTVLAGAAEPPTDDPAGAAKPPQQADVLQPGDMLRIEVYDNPDLFRWIRVPVGGGISFPLIGDIRTVVGRRTDDLADEIRRRLEADFLQRAVVSLTVTEYGPRQAYVMGSVAVPGPVAISATAGLSALQAIGNSRGFTEDADRSATHILRDQPDGTKIRIPVRVPSDRGQPPQDVPLVNGDIVVVPRQDRVYIIGQVVKPGAVSLPSEEPLTVSKAVSLAGGFDRFAKQGEVQLIRADEPTRVIDVRAILAGDRRVNDVRLLPGDTVFVPESRL